MVKIYTKIYKSALIFFNKLINLIKNDEYNILYNNELKLFNSETGEIFLYDFLIKELKLIIEYNGGFWHPRPNMPNWNNTKQNIKKYEKDMRKIKTAEDYGYKVIEIWDKIDDNFNLKKIMEVINEIKRQNC